MRILGYDKLRQLTDEEAAFLLPAAGNLTPQQEEEVAYSDLDAILEHAFEVFEAEGRLESDEVTEMPCVEIPGKVFQQLSEDSPFVRAGVHRGRIAYLTATSEHPATAIFTFAKDERLPDDKPGVHQMDITLAFTPEQTAVHVDSKIILTETIDKGGQYFESMSPAELNAGMAIEVPDSRETATWIQEFADRPDELNLVGIKALTSVVDLMVEDVTGAALV